MAHALNIVTGGSASRPSRASAPPDARARAVPAGSPSWAGCCWPAACSRAAARTCTTRRATKRSRRATSSPTSGRCARSRKARSRAATCARTTCTTPASATAKSIQELPAQVKVDKALLDRGQQRFNIYCAPCHSPLGDGNGTVVQRGYKRPASYHDPRLRNMGIGYFYDVITQRLRPDAGLRGAGGARRSLGDRRLHPRAAAQPGGHDRGRAGRPSRRTRRQGAGAPEASHGGGAAHD